MLVAFAQKNVSHFAHANFVAFLQDLHLFIRFWLRCALPAILIVTDFETNLSCLEWQVVYLKPRSLRAMAVACVVVSGLITLPTDNAFAVVTSSVRTYS